MGKDRKQQRTKGNTQAASSTAALSSASSSVSASAANPFLGFSAFSNVAVPGINNSAGPGLSFAATDEGPGALLDASVPPELVVVLRKLAKKDAVTKTKALEELHTLLERQPDLVPQLIPLWPRIFSRLGIDVERRVRIKIFEVHSLLVDQAKKALAPHLKSIISTWLLGRFDRDVETLARKSFEAAFSPAKRSTVFEHCRESLLEELDDLLCHKTPETLSDPRFSTKMDMDSKYERTVSCALQSLAFLSEQLASPLDVAESSLARHFSSTFPAIRRAMAATAQSFLLAGYDLPVWQEQLLSRVWEETDTRVAGDIWQALLKALQSNAGFVEYAQSAARIALLAKKCRDFVAKRALLVPAAFSGVIVLLSILVDIPIQPCWDAARDVARKLLNDTSVQIVPLTSKRAFWTFVTDLLLMVKSRNADVLPLYTEVLTGFLSVNAWSPAMRQCDEDVLRLLTVPTLLCAIPESTAALLESFAFADGNAKPFAQMLTLMPQDSPAAAAFIRFAQEKLSDSFATGRAPEHHWLLEMFSGLAHRDSQPSLSFTQVKHLAAHCNDCLTRSLTLCDVEDVETVAQFVTKSLGPEALVVALDSLPRQPSRILTDYCATHLDTEHLPLLLAAMRGHIHRDELILTAIKESPKVAKALIVSCRTIRNAEIAQWCLANLPDEEWSQIGLEVDVRSFLKDALLDPTVDASTWTRVFERLGAPLEDLCSDAVISVLARARVRAPAGAFFDLPDKLQFADSLSQDVIRTLSSKLKRVQYRSAAMNPLVPSWLLFCSLLSATLGIQISLQVGEDAVDVLFNVLASQQPLYPAHVLAFHQLANQAKPSVGLALTLLRRSSSENEFRLAAALLAASPNDSSALEMQAEKLAAELIDSPSLTRLMLLNATRWPTRTISPVEAAEIVEHITEEATRKMPTFIHCAMFLSRHTCPEIPQFCWMWLEDLPVDSEWLPAFWDAVVTLLHSVGASENSSEEDLVLVTQRVVELWLATPAVSPSVSKYVTTASIALFDEGPLYNKLRSANLHEQAAAAHLLHRKIGLKVQELSLQFDVTAYDGISDELQLHSTLRENIEAAHVAAFEGEMAWLLSWAAVFRHFDAATLGLKSFWLESIDMNPLLSFLAAALSDFGDRAIRLWDVTRFEPLALLDGQFSHEDEHLIVSLVCANLYFQALVQTPTRVRSWWSECRDKQMTRTLEKVTADHFTPSIWDMELSSVGDQVTDLKVVVMRSSSSVQVSARYSIDDAEMELRIVLPGQYPLRPVDVTGGDHSVVSDATWRAWILSCKSILSMQNTGISDALQVFLRNIRLHLSGVTEPCAICWSIVGVSCKTLPTKPCRTCKKQFHGSCLYKWFKSSPQSTCPLCRSLF
ncbi:hypothetical protein BCR44DRAFT_157690 [Catenaria anguillulae PL171]|uniref:E3 ubiquitin-protein ligase listerin n=1 Tax=Catenaria anguillulae PL171 TaxID=765915 RepID=A0A1Y2HUY2_9FUNG|nr:hypothetical protein BCR44DRAFT_157690 [Catenaria anguillulae PL171]